MTGEKIITLAKKYLGSKGNKFVSDYGIAWGSHWCCAFVWDIFRLAGASNLFYGGQKTAYVPTVTVWMQANLRHVTMKEAKAGDIVVFTWSGNGFNKERGSRDHIGFIRKAGTQNVCYTLEGNTGASDPKQTTVMERTRGAAYIYGIYRPKYADQYTIKFKGRTATSGVMKSIKVDVGETIKLPKNAFTRTGFKFVGWSVGKSDVITMKRFQIGKVKYKNKAEVKNLAKAGKSVTLWACWKGTGPEAAARWARFIAADNSFMYGTGPDAHHNGCYYCGTNQNGKYGKPKTSRWAKTYCCNPFVMAAYTHGANLFSSCPKSGLTVAWWTKLSKDDKKLFKKIGTDLKYADLKPGDILIKNNHHIKIYVGKINGFHRVSHAASEGWGPGSIRTDKVSGRTGKEYTVLRFI